MRMMSSLRLVPPVVTITYNPTNSACWVPHVTCTRMPLVFLGVFWMRLDECKMCVIRHLLQAAKQAERRT